MRDTDLSGFGPVETNGKPDDCRAEFERLAKSEGLPIKTYSEVPLRWWNEATERAWRGYKACWRHLKEKGDE